MAVGASNCKPYVPKLGTRAITWDRLVSCSETLKRSSPPKNGKEHVEYTDANRVAKKLPRKETARKSSGARKGAHRRVRRRGRRCPHTYVRRRPTSDARGRPGGAPGKHGTTQGPTKGQGPSKEGDVPGYNPTVRNRPLLDRGEGGQLSGEGVTGGRTVYLWGGSVPGPKETPWRPAGEEFFLSGGPPVAEKTATEDSAGRSGCVWSGYGCELRTVNFKIVDGGHNPNTKDKKGGSGRNSKL